VPRPKKRQESQRRPSPVQFRLESDLGQLVDTFAVRHSLSTNEAAKAMIALCVSELDCRYYELLRQLADAVGGSTPFVRACLHVQAALEGARRASGNPMQSDTDRGPFIVSTVQDALAAKGIQVQTPGMWFTPSGERPHQPERRDPHPDPFSRKRRIIRHKVFSDEAARSQSTGEGGQAGLVDDPGVPTTTEQHQSQPQRP
jgi:hypothetical protein